MVLSFNSYALYRQRVKKVRRTARPSTWITYKSLLYGKNETFYKDIGAVSPIYLIKKGINDILIFGKIVDLFDFPILNSPK